MQRLAIFIPSLEGGGAERMMATLANHMAASGHRVDLVLAAARGPYLVQVSRQVRVIDLKASRLLTALPSLVRYLRRERPDAMLSAMLHANVVAVVARAISGAPVRLVISERNTASRDLDALTPLAAFVLKQAMLLTYPRADGITAVSSGVADDLADFIGLERDAIKVVYNPVVTEDLLRSSKLDPGDRWLPLEGRQSVPVILAAGRLSAQKDLQTLVRAFAIVRKARDSRLLILGEGERRSEIEHQISSLELEDSVRLCGFVENPYAFMRRCNVFVLSSRWEGLPGVVIQAMACGAPIVSTDCPSGPNEILENGRWGRLVPVGDAEAMAQAILETLDDPTPPDVRHRALRFGAPTATRDYLAALGVSPAETT